VSAETAETRRAAGQLCEKARKALFPQVSKRQLAARLGVSETWYRAVTTGLSGQDPRPGSDELWVAIAREVRLDPAQVFTTLGRPLPNLGTAGRQPAVPGSPIADRGRLVGPAWPLREGEVLEWEALASGKTRYHLYSTDTGRGADYAWLVGPTVEDVVSWLRELMADVDEAAARMLRKHRNPE
jgi:hypothetical protein